MSTTRWIPGLHLAIFTLALALLPGALPAATPPDDEALGFERTPPRLSLVDGEVSFWRSGAPEWAEARVNTPLAEGDEIYAGEHSSLEIQLGGRAFARAGERTQLGVTSLEPDYLQLRITQGIASLDLRSLAAGQTFEVGTPHAAFTVERTGYYRIEVTEDATRFTTRRGGHASVTTADGRSAAIAASEQLLVTNGDGPVLETYAAPDLDDWDRWNYERTDGQIEALSSRYVPAGVYGVDDLDHHGSWRVVPTYGAVWVPRVAPGWVPYSTGDWIYDPYYGWTWVDDAPWGWAPFHYGRWVFVGGYWAWCPGPRVVRVYYAPALVAFYHTPTLSISFGHRFGWVALGWGEPLVPWWGPSHWRRHPRWGGWGGPRVVNNVVIEKTTIVNVTHIERYANAKHRGAIVAVDRGDFGRRRVHDARLAKYDTSKLRPFRGGDLDVKPSPRSLVATDRRGSRPPRADLERKVVATREPRRAAVPELERRRDSERQERGRDTRASEARIPSGPPPARVVTRQPTPRTERAPARPPFGRRGDQERAAPAPPPRFEDVRQRRPSAGRSPEPRESRPQARQQPEPPRQREREARQAPPAPAQREAPREGRPPAERERAARPPREMRPETHGALPGEPANRVYRGNHGERGARDAERRTREAAPAQRPPRAEERPRQQPRERGSQPQGRRHDQQPQQERERERSEPGSRGR
jgi:hypothetical protein